MTSHRFRSYKYLVLVAAIWGIAGPVIKYTLGGIDPFPFLSYRLAISATFSLIFFAVKGINLQSIKNSLPKIILYGLLAITLTLGSLFNGLDRSSVLDFALIATLGPLLTVLGGSIFFRDHITHREKIGIAIVITGALLNSFGPLFGSSDGLRLTGNIFIIIALIADSSSALFAKKFVKKEVSSSTLTNAAFIVGALTLIPYTIATYGAGNLYNSIVTLPFKYHLGVWYMALISGSLAYYLFVKGQKSIEVSEASLFSYLQPLFSIPLAMLWLGESITKSFVVGAILIAAGLFIAERKNKHKNIATS